MLRFSKQVTRCQPIVSESCRRLLLRSFGSSSEIPESSSVRKRLDVAIVGAPNAGKSQLLNVLVKSPVAAVSRKRHTTRTDILGARTIGDTQIVFKDTPGFLRIENAKEERLDRDLIATAASEMQHVDYSFLVVDAARSLTDNYRHALAQLMDGAIKSKGRTEEDYDEEDAEAEETRKLSEPPRCKFAIVLNKVDLVTPKKKLIGIAMEIGAIADACLLNHYGGKEAGNEGLDFETVVELSPVVFYVSALEEDGTEEMMEHLVDLATPCRTWAVEAGQTTNMTSLQHVQELIREKIYRCLHKEVPHSVQQVNRMFRKVPQGLVIHQDLVVFTKSHQRLVLGSGGQTLRRIQVSAARDLGKIFDCDVVLRLHVKFSTSKNRRGAEEYVQGEISQSVH